MPRIDWANKDEHAEWKRERFRLWLMLIRSFDRFGTFLLPVRGSPCSLLQWVSVDFARPKQPICLLLMLSYRPKGGVLPVYVERRQHPARNSRTMAGLGNVRASSTEKAVRPVPLPPQLIEWLRLHIERWPTDNGLIFSNNAGRSVTAENYGKVWNREKAKLWPTGHRLSDTDPYDLRHTAVTAMLRAHVPLPEVARRLGHSVEVLLKVYTGVFDDERERSNGFIEAEFARQGVR